MVEHEPSPGKREDSPIISIDALFKGVWRDFAKHVIDRLNKLQGVLYAGVAQW